MKLEWISSPSRANSTDFGLPGRWLLAAPSQTTSEQAVGSDNIVVECVIAGQKYGILESDLLEIVAVSVNSATRILDGQVGYPGFLDFRGEPLGLIDLSVLAGGTSVSGSNVPCLLPKCQSGVGYLVESIVSLREWDLSELGPVETVAGLPSRSHPSGVRILQSEGAFKPYEVANS